MKPKNIASVINWKETVKLYDLVTSGAGSGTSGTKAVVPSMSGILATPVPGSGEKGSPGSPLEGGSSL